LRRLMAIHLLVLISMFFLSCGKPSDQKTYEEVVATMSMEKAKKFFTDYPQSQYRERLVNEIMEWCRYEETEEGYRLAIDALPEDHPRFKEFVAYYEKHFLSKQ